MEGKIEQYLIDDQHIESEDVRKLLTDKVLRYTDIAEEFLYWLGERKYKDDGVRVGDYTARDVYEMAPALDGIGAFNFLVTLRDNPKKAQEIIESDFVIL